MQALDAYRVPTRWRLRSGRCRPAALDGHQIAVGVQQHRCLLTHLDWFVEKTRREREARVADLGEHRM